MIVNLHIERLVLDGASPAAQGEGAQVEAAVRAELARLYAQAGASALPRSSAAAPVLRGTAVTAAPTQNAAQLGNAVAKSLYGVLEK